MAKNEFIKINPDILVVPRGWNALGDTILKLKDIWERNQGWWGLYYGNRTPNEVVSVSYRWGPRKCDVTSFRVRVYKRKDGCYVNLAVIKKDEWFAERHPDHLPKFLKALLPPTKSKVELES